jgi:RES domain-containing protein
MARLRAALGLSAAVGRGRRPLRRALESGRRAHYLRRPRTLDRAWAEYNQGFVQHPALIAQLELTGASLADLTDPVVLATLGVGPEIHKCEWRALLDEGRTPATHLLRKKLIEDGKDGVVYPSFMSPGGTCVALWHWNGEGAPKLRIVDPGHRLPRTPASWL